MVLVSIGVHFALTGVGVLWMAMGSSPPRHLTPVPMVDLVGAFPPERSEAPVQTPPKAVEPPRPKKAAPKTKEPAPRKDAPAPRPGAMAPHDAKPEPVDVRKAVEALRGRKQVEANARQAIEEMRAQRELAERMKSLRDRAAHQINLAQVGPVTGGAPPTGALPDAKPEEVEYARNLHEKIHQSWTETVSNARSLVAVVRIKIQRDGYVPAAGVEVMKTSGNSYFDESVRRAIMKASPLPVPPEKLRGGETYFDVMLNFYGSGGV